MRSRLLAVLSPAAIMRIGIDLGCAAGLAFLAVPLITLGSEHRLHWADLLLVLPALLVGGLAGRVSVGLLRRAAHLLGDARAPRGSWLAFGMAVLVLAGWVAIPLFLAAGHGPASTLVARVIAAAVPAALVLVFGGWACALTHRRVRTARSRWLRGSPDAIAALLIALALVVLFRRDLLATEPAAGLLFPLAAWGSVRTWREMSKSERLTVRAGADIALSLLLGADLVLFAVWLANLFDIPAGEVAVLRGTLERAGGILDLPWWLWALLYLLLAGASLAFALWPERLSVVSQWWQRLRLVPSVEVTSRILSGVHIGLAVTVLIGLTAPPAVDWGLRGRLQATYTLAVQREFAADGEQAAYAQIRQEFSFGTPTSTSVRPLIGVVSKIHDISSPPPGRDGATATERDIARRVGRMQAATLRVSAPPAEAAAAGSSDSQSRRDGRQSAAGAPGGAVTDLRDRLGELAEQQERTRKVARQAEKAGELAAAAVAATIQIPGLGRNEIGQIITEYLSGLVESSPLKDVFAAWARRLAGRTAPPPADLLVIPDPPRLEDVAFIVLIKERVTVQLADPLEADRAQQRAFQESPVAAAVDLANEARFLQEDSGPCADCPHPLEPGDEHIEGPGEHPEEPHEFVP